MNKSLIPWRPRPDGTATPQRGAFSKILGQVLSGNRQNALAVKREWSELENPTTRFPCCIVADASSSMSGNPIDEENRGLRTLGANLRENEIASKSAEIGVVSVGYPLAVIAEFTPADRFYPPELCAYGDTPLAEGILMAIQLTEERLRHIEQLDLEAFRPWIIVISDGLANGGNATQKAIREIRRVEKRKLMSVFAIGVNEEATRNLQEFTVRKAVTLRDFNFNSLFRWVSQRVIQVSVNGVGDDFDNDEIMDAEWRKF